MLRNEFENTEVQFCIWVNSHMYTLLFKKVEKRTPPAVTAGDVYSRG
jgi:hypothetical protein